MGYQLKNHLCVSKLASILGLTWRGIDVKISRVSSVDEADEGSLCFAKMTSNIAVDLAATIIAPPGTLWRIGAVIESTTPRLSFAKALLALSQTPGFLMASENPRIGKDTVISKTAFLGKGVVIGERTIIGHNVIVEDGVRIGDDCVIKSNTVIGEAGFGFERDLDNIPVRILHLGGVVIGNRVEIGSLNTVCRGTLSNTVIEDDVKIDDHVHIAHNCRIRRGSLVTACAELSGGVDIGEFSWIGPNSSIIQKAVLGAHSFVGIGSNIIRSIPEHGKVAGNPAKILPRK
jgi:UDP-3-O-[3-hydroxymyristoyl] glucosamine N-acyltransferase